MMLLTVIFDADWVKGKKDGGIRVLRNIEKWIASFAEYHLKKVYLNKISVEVKTSAVEDFKKSLAQKVLNDFQVDDPSKIISYESSVCGGGSSSESASKDKTSEAPVPVEGESTSERDESKSDGGIVSEKEAPHKEEKKIEKSTETLDDILAESPFKQSRELQGYMYEIDQVVPMLKEMGEMASFWHKSLLLAIDDGYGLTDFLRGLGRLYCIHGIAGSKDLNRLVREIKVNVGTHQETYYNDWDEALTAAKAMQRDNENKEGGRAVLCLDVGAWQDKLFTKEVKSYLRKLNANSKNYTLVFRIPFVEARAMSSVEDALDDIFSIRSLVVSPPPVTVLATYAKEQFNARGFVLSDEATDVMERRIISEKWDDSFFGYKTVDKVVDSIIYEKALINCRKGTVDRDITKSDIIVPNSSDSSEQTNVEEDMSGLIGLDSVKEKIYEIVAQIKTQQKLVAKGGKVARPTIHMLFSGNPGTGKTTVARLVARLLKKEGVLRKGHLIEVKGRDLCGKYVGQTAPKTSAICRDAYGSVLFIDEAYSLFRGEDSSGYDYGREALDTLIAEMENHRDDMCVILAGYSDDINIMLSGNIGMKSRIPFNVEFPNYTKKELGDIFFSMLNNDFEYEESLKDAVYDFFNRIPDDVFKEKSFSNARFVRNLYERTWGRAAYRSRLEDGDIKILASDLLGAAEEKEFKQLVERNVRKPIGFDSWTE